MYHIKNDKREISSASLICESLSMIMKKKEYKDINVSEVCAYFGVARTTFYRLFDILDDVLIYQFNKLFIDSLTNFNNNIDSHFAKTMIEVAVSNKPLITAIVCSGRSDLLFDATKANEKAILSSTNIVMSEEDRKDCNSILGQIAFGVIKIWVTGGC